MDLNFAPWLALDVIIIFIQMLRQLTKFYMQKNWTYMYLLLLTNHQEITATNSTGTNNQKY